MSVRSRIAANDASPAATTPEWKAQATGIFRPPRPAAANLSRAASTAGVGPEIVSDPAGQANSRLHAHDASAGSSSEPWAVLDLTVVAFD